METTKFSITLGARGYNFDVPTRDFLAYLNNEMKRVNPDNSNIEIPQFINLYLKKCYSHFQLAQEYERLREENEILKAKLQKQEDDLMGILNTIKTKDN